MANVLVSPVSDCVHKLEYNFKHYGVQCRGGANDIDDSFLADAKLTGSNPEKSKDTCNTFTWNMGCLNSVGHEGKTVPDNFVGTVPLDRKCGHGKASIFVQAIHCHDPLCPACCYNWAKKQVKRSMGYFDVFDLVFGSEFELRHIIVSVAECDWHLSLKDMRKQVSAFAEGVGVVGFMCIFHPKRYNGRLRTWYFSPHFHLVGYVKDGWIDGVLVKKIHDLTGYVLKNKAKRKSVAGTIFYQLSHAGIPSGHSHAVTWHGELNYRKRVHPELRELMLQNRLEAKRLADSKKVCPLCAEKLVYVSRVPGAEPFNYRLYEEHFVLDSVLNWFKVDLPHRRRRFSDSDEDDWKGSNG